MKYQSLYSLYYKSQNDYESEYQGRFHSAVARHLSLSVSQFGRQAEHTAFFCYTEEIALLQDEIMASFQKFTQIDRKLPDFAMPIYLQTCIIEEIKSTNDIEGVRSTRREIMEALGRPASERHKLRLGSLVNQYQNIISGQDICLDSCLALRNLYDEVIADEIRRDNPHNLPDGKIFRRDSVDIVSSTQKTIHRGIYPEEKIVAYMDKALEVLHDETMPIFVRVAIFHYLFGYIHPFYDGNGRLSRFITAYYLAQRLHPAVALGLSVLLKNQRKKYYKLFSITDADCNRGDLTPFLTGMLEFIAEALQNTNNALLEKLNRYETCHAKQDVIPMAGKNTKQLYDLLLQGSIFSEQGLSMKELQSYLEKSENTVYSHLKKLPEGLLITDSRTKNYRYKLSICAL